VEDWSAPAYCWKLLSCEILFAHYLYVFLMKKFNNINKMVSFYLSQLPKAVTSGIFHSVDLVSKWLFCFIENFIGYFGLDSKATDFTERWQHQHKNISSNSYMCTVTKVVRFSNLYKIFLRKRWLMIMKRGESVTCAGPVYLMFSYHSVVVRRGSDP